MRRNRSLDFPLCNSVLWIRIRWIRNKLARTLNYELPIRILTIKSNIQPKKKKVQYLIIPIPKPQAHKHVRRIRIRPDP
jgi:hypothetical protein